MRTSLGDLFIESRGAPIDVNGQSVHLWAELGPLAQAVLGIRLSATSEHGQALCMSAKGGEVEIAGQRSTSMVLWADTAPPTVDVRTWPGKSGAMVIRFWNAWRGAHDVMHSGIGNVGMLVTHGDNRLRLECSDGWGDISFGDLVVEIAF